MSTTRIDWADIARAARETSEALAGTDWVSASIKARVLLADLADEIERLQSAIRQAIEAAEEEGIHRHRGTDEPRRFVAILREAVAARRAGDREDLG